MTLACEMAVADCVLEWIKENSTWIDVEPLFTFECMVDEYGITSAPEQLFACVWCHTFGHHRVLLQPQKQVGRYRIDFALSPLEHFLSCPDFPDETIKRISEKLPTYAIEIDGFEWHDKTPEQAERDKKRERYIQSQGYTVLRFAAREVLRDPVVAAREVSQRIGADIRSIFSNLTFK